MRSLAFWSLPGPFSLQLTIFLFCRIRLPFYFNIPLMKQVIFYLSFALFLVLSACTDPLTVGSDLLQADRASVGQTMDILFTTRVVKDDSLVAFDPEIAELPLLSSFTIGRLQDDIFGSWKNSAYLGTYLYRQPNTGLAIKPSFIFKDTARVDSVVFILPIDTAFALYGSGGVFDFQAQLLGSRIDESRSYATNGSLPINPMAINGRNQFRASKTPSILWDTIYNTNRDTILQSHIRFNLNDDYLTRINNLDENAFNSDDSLATFLPGIYLEPGENIDGLVALRAQIGPTVSTGFHFFYPDTTTAVQRRFLVQLANWIPRYERDFTGSLVGQLMEMDESNVQIAVAGQAGLMTEITFPDLTALADKVINKAELTFFHDIIDGYSYDTYGTPQFVGLYYRNEFGQLVTIRDFSFVSQNQQTDILRENSGGDVRTDADGDKFYAPRLSLHLQEMIAGTVPNKIYLRVVPSSRDPSRVILKGRAAAEKPATFTVTFTELGE